MMTKIKKWLIALIFGVAVFAAGTQPITLEEVKWKDFTDNLINIKYKHCGRDIKELKNIKGIWEPTEQEFEEIYKYVYGSNMVNWQSVDGTERCINDNGMMWNCIEHWGQEYNNAKERGIKKSNIVKGLRNGVRMREVSGVLISPQFVFERNNFIGWFIKSVHAGVEFSDTFTVDTNTLLQDRIPDTGTGWTKIISVGGGNDLYIYAISDFLTSRYSSTNAGSLYETDDTISTANYTVKIDQIDGKTAGITTQLCCRIQDANNMYCLRWNEDDADLYKNVGGSWSTIDTTGTGIADGSKVELICEGTSISVEDDDVEILSAIDNSHSSAGKAGVGMGAVIISTDDNSGQDHDNFVVTVNGAPPPDRRIIIIE